MQKKIFFKRENILRLSCPLLFISEFWHFHQCPQYRTQLSFSEGPLFSEKGPSLTLNLKDILYFFC